MNKCTSLYILVIFTCMVATYLATSLLLQFCVIKIMLIELCLYYISIMDNQVYYILQVYFNIYWWLREINSIK